MLALWEQWWWMAHCGELCIPGCWGQCVCEPIGNDFQGSGFGPGTAWLPSTSQNGWASTSWVPSGYLLTVLFRCFPASNNFWPYGSSTKESMGPQAKNRIGRAPFVHPFGSRLALPGGMLAPTPSPAQTHAWGFTAFVHFHTWKWGCQPQPGECL